MMTVLLESAGVRGPKRTGWTIASISVHGAMIVGAIVLTTQAPMIVESIDEPFIPVVPWVSPQPLEPAPADPAITSLPGAPAIPSLPLTLPNIPTFDVDEPFAPNVIPGADVFDRSTAPIASRAPAPTDGVHTYDNVERVAAPLAGNGSPDYPRQLRAAGVEGSVIVTFVVDPAGRAEPSSITIVAATHPLFAEAVRRWLLRTRYTPGEIRGTRVRQLVQQEVGFELKD